MGKREILYHGLCRREAEAIFFWCREKRGGRGGGLRAKRGGKEGIAASTSLPLEKYVIPVVIGSLHVHGRSAEVGGVAAKKERLALSITLKSPYHREGRGK